MKQSASRSFNLHLALACSFLLPPCAAGAQDQVPVLAGVSQAERAAIHAYEQALLTIPTPDALRSWHDLTSSHPHRVNTPGDRKTVEQLEKAFAEMGLSVERHEFWPYLPTLESASVSVLPGDADPIELQLHEDPIDADPFTQHPDLGIAWNAYSGSGTAQGEVVYANYGRKEDFQRLAQLGIDVQGKIVIARYGGNFRGHKAVYAQAAGAAGLLMYTDPADSGYMRGLMYPEGGYQTPTSIQRGSIKAIGYPGDPLTPGIEATRDAARITPEQAGLPAIPVQAISWAGAHEILSRMDGLAVPSGWQGGLPFAYRLTASPSAVQVRLSVEQPREIVPAHNVIATVRGTTWPDEWIIIGCHHDAWGFGAGDPDAGTIVMLEAARAIAQLAAQGQRPKRSVLFAAWGAEEFGIIGSTEWVERHLEHLRGNAVAYINLDMAAMGPNFGSSAHPALHDLIRSAARSVPQARNNEQSVYQSWGRGGEPAFGVLGGGSDHVGFLCHAGVPSLSLGAGGSPGVSYHTNYDTLHWYRQVVGNDYEPALMLTRMTLALTARLAQAPLMPVDPAAQTRTAAQQMAALRSDMPLDPLIARAETIAARAERVRSHLHLLAEQEVLRAFEIQRANALLRSIDRAWLDERGLPDLPWFRNLTVAPDPYSGYSSWTMPALRLAREWGDDRASDLAVVLAQHDAALTRVEESLAQLEALIAGQ